LKSCCDCKQSKSLNQFYLSNGKYPHPRCKSCEIKFNYSASRKKYISGDYSYIDKNLKTRYGLSEEERNKWFRLQPDCEVCGEMMIKPHIDHSHSRNVIRGLICNRCNLMIGMAKDDPNILLAAADYLKVRRDGTDAVA